MQLTKEQIEELAERLIHTSRNVFSEAQLKFNIEVGDEVFDQLEVHGKIFKCEMCNTWKWVDVKDPDLNDMCTECVEEENG